jgi:protein SCO1/2
MIRLFLLLSFVLLPNEAWATAPGTQEKALATSQAALGRTLPDIQLQNANGETLRLRDFRGKPLLLSLIYTSCSDVCPALIEHLHPAVEVARDALGDGSFSVMTVGFDVRKDRPQQMLSFAKAQGVGLPDWHFLSADQEALHALANSVGFAYFSRPGGFDHMAQVSVIDEKGRLYTQIYGAVFEPQSVVEPLKNLVYGREKPLNSWAGLVGRIKWFCTTYNPNSGRYQFNYSFFISLAIGAASLALVLTILIREWQRSAGPKNGHV